MTTPATRTFTVDTTAPETTIDSAPVPFTFSSSEAEFDVRVQARRGRVRVVHLAVHARGLADGEHTFSVRAIDAAGNTDQTPATRTFTVDTVAPETTIDVDVECRTRSRRAKPNSTFECKLDSGAFASCTSPYVVGTFADGEHTFSVRAIDAAGNTDQSPATRTFTVDTVAPETTITSTSSPYTFSSSEANSTFECKLDTAAYAVVHLAAFARHLG